MAADMRVNIKTIKSMDMGFILGLIHASIKDFGSKVNNTV
jgi:hypothetical protein